MKRFGVALIALPWAVPVFVAAAWLTGLVSDRSDAIGAAVAIAFAALCAAICSAIGMLLLAIGRVRWTLRKGSDASRAA